MFKKQELVMASISKESPFATCDCSEHKGDLINIKYHDSYNYKYYHFYVITNDSINASDYYFDLFPSTPFGVGVGDSIKKCTDPYALDEGTYKIIASTDPNLGVYSIPIKAINTFIKKHNIDKDFSSLTLNVKYKKHNLWDALLLDTSDLGYIKLKGKKDNTLLELATKVKSNKSEIIEEVSNWVKLFIT